MINKIVIGREAFDKIMYYVHKAKFEISGLGNVQIIDGIPTVTDIILLKQKNDPTETEIDGEAISKAIYDHHVACEAGEMEGELKFWWHSHVNMSCFWSGTDVKTMESLTENGWFIHGVFNKKNEYKCAYTNNEPVQITLDDLELEIDENMIFNPRIIELQNKIEEAKDDLEIEMGIECDAKFDECVTEKVWTPTYTDGGQHWQKRFQQGKTFEGKFQTVEPLLTTTTEISGNITQNNFTDITGALELLELGFKEYEIQYMQEFMWIYDANGVNWYESHYNANVQDDLDFEFLNKQA